MPYIKKDELKGMLKHAFMMGIMAGFDTEHEFYNPANDEVRFDEFYRKYIEKKDTKGTY